MVEIGAEFSQGLENELKVRSSDFGCRLVVIGQIDQGHAELVMDERGEVYYLFDPLKKIASSIDEALVMLLLGYRPAHPLPPCLFEEIETP